MGAVSIVFNQSASGSNAIDLTSITKNPGATPVTTPRQGGFTLRNRIDASKLSSTNTKLFTVTAKSSGSTSVNTMYVLEVPRKTLVKNVTQKNVAGATAPTTAFTGVHASGNSFASGAMLQLGAAAHTTNSQAALKLDLTDGHAAVSSLDGCVFGNLAITKETGATAGLPSKVSTTSTTPWAGGLAWNIIGATEKVHPLGQYFPYGGFVTLAIGPHGVTVSSVSSAHLTNSTTVADIAGVWDFMAECEYLPE